MNKLLKTTGVFILGVGLLTGCSHTSTQKSDNSNESSKVAVAHVDENKDKNDNGNKVTEENSNNNVAQENNGNNSGYKAASDNNDQNSKITQNNSDINRAIQDSSYVNKVTRYSAENNKVVKDNNSTSKAAQNNSNSSKVAQNTKKTQQNVSGNKATVTNSKNVSKNEKKSVEQKNVKNNNDVKAAEQQNSAYKHNFKEVEKLLNIINYSFSNTKNSKMIDIIRFSANITITKNQVVYLPAANLLDRLNTNNAETYNVNAVLNKLFVENGVKLVTANKAKSEYTPTELEKLVPDNNTVVYFKKDNMFAIRGAVGYGATSDLTSAPTDKWKVEGDKILIPFVTVSTNKPAGLMTVRLNNKVYQNGQNKTMYYVESFIYY